MTTVVKEVRDDVHLSIKQTKFLHHTGRRWCLCGVWDALVMWFGKQAKGLLRYVDGSYIKLRQYGLQGSKLKREKQAIGLSRGGIDHQAAGCR